MPRLAIVNMLIGFTVLFLAASAGAFIANDLTQGFLRDKAFLDTWVMMLSKSSHGHTNLFALIHIAFGLTMPYSIWGPRIKLLQTVGFALGVVAMGPVLLVRAYYGPTEAVDPVEIAIGIMLSCALAALFTHAAGLFGKLLRRA